MKYKTNLYTNSQGKIQPMVEVEHDINEYISVEKKSLVNETLDILIQLRNKVREAGFKLVDDP